jgi:hypothetical protein
MTGHSTRRDERQHSVNTAALSVSSVIARAAHRSLPFTTSPAVVAWTLARARWPLRPSTMTAAYESDHSRYLVRGHGTDRGALVCHACGLRRRHVLEWPREAWFQIEYRCQVLWALGRASALALLEHVRSADRRRRRGPWSSMLLHVPTVFLEASAREAVAKRLALRLEDG